MLPVHLRAHGHPQDEAALREAVARKHAEYERAIRQSMRLVPGAADFVENAALDGFQLAIVSGALRSEIELVLELAGLRPHFAEIVAAEDVGACKPDPAGLQSGPGNARARSQALRSGRRFAPGLNAARAAGLRCAMLATSHPGGRLQRRRLVWRDFVGHDAAELPWAHV